MKKNNFVKNQIKNMNFIKNAGITALDQLAAISPGSAAAEFQTLEKRPRPDKFTFSITNATDATKTYSLLSGVNATVKPADAVDIFNNETDRRHLLMMVQKPLVVGFILSVNADADAAQLNQDVKFVKVDYNDSKATSLAPLIANARPTSKDENLSRVVAAKFVLDESTDLLFDVLPGKTLTVTLNFKEYLNRPW